MIESARQDGAAIAWGRNQITHPSQNWFRLCKAFSRSCFAVPSDGTPNAGAAWDRAHFKHRETNPQAFPAAVLVHWEMPSVEDHVAVTTGNGMCLSTDFLRTGRVDEVSIDRITREWGGQLLGWAEDIDGQRVWTPPEPPPPPKPDSTRITQARAHVWDAIALIDEAIEHGRGDSVVGFRRDLRRALRRAPKT